MAPSLYGAFVFSPLCLSAFVATPLAQIHEAFTLDFLSELHSLGYLI